MYWYNLSSLPHLLILTVDDNYFWTGLFVYSSGCIVVMEDLSTGKQTHMLGKHMSVAQINVLPILYVHV